MDKEVQIQEIDQVKQAEPKPEKFHGILEIKERTKNLTFDREIVTAVINSTRTPSKEEVKKLLAAELKADPELIALKGINSSFGKKEFHIQAFIYKNKETFQKLEVRKKKEAKKAKEEKKEEAQETKEEQETPKDKETRQEAKPEAKHEKQTKKEEIK